MIHLFESINSPLLQAFIAGLMTWFLTLIGAAFVFLGKNPSLKTLDAMLGFAAGVMIAASYWSLLSPAIEIAENIGQKPWISVSIGFAAGALFLWSLDRIVPHLHLGAKEDEKEGLKTNLNKTFLFVLAITLHNIPEGLAVGVAFGSITNNLSSATVTSAFALALGIGIQNLPEGFAVSMPLFSNGFSKFKSFFWGQLSAFVEPISALLGVLFVYFFQDLLPYAMAFAAGAMVYVVVEEVIPEAERHKNTDIATIFFIIGFMVMMILDVALG